jgi:hypothetical protein
LSTGEVIGALTKVENGNAGALEFEKIGLSEGTRLGEPLLFEILLIGGSACR